MNKDFKGPAFLYGESVFTTLKVVDGVIMDAQRHLEKLVSDAQGYYMLSSQGDLLKKAQTMLVNIQGSGALRITISAPARHSLISNFSEDDLIVSHQFREVDLSKVKPVRLKLYKRLQDELSCQYKIGSYGKELFLKRVAINEGFDDVLFYGEGKVFETSTANIFFRKGKVLYTPKSGIYKGLTRQNVISSQNVIERDILIEEINEFDEIFLTNSIFEKVIVSDIM